MHEPKRGDFFGNTQWGDWGLGLGFKSHFHPIFKQNLPKFFKNVKQRKSMITDLEKLWMRFATILIQIPLIVWVAHVSRHNFFCFFCFLGIRVPKNWTLKFKRPKFSLVCVPFLYHLPSVAAILCADIKKRLLLGRDIYFISLQFITNSEFESWTPSCLFKYSHI